MVNARARLRVRVKVTVNARARVRIRVRAGLRLGLLLVLLSLASPVSPWRMENPCRSGRFSSKGNGAKASRHPRLATNLGEIWEQLERLVSLLAWREAWPAEGQEESTICLRVNFN